jgi:nucleoside-diphosphate-sugar epimerase
MRVAVTGGTGYLGAHTVRALLAAGHSVRLLATPADAASAVVDGLTQLGELTVVTGDIRDEVAVGELLDASDALVHAAGVVGTDRRRSELCGRSMPMRARPF